MRLAGVAATVRCVAVDGVPDDHSEWHRGTIDAVDALEPGDVLVASTCEAAFWGELLATASRQRGARGIVADAFARDTLELIDMGFATFARGIYCADALGRIRVDAPGRADRVRRRDRATPATSCWPTTTASSCCPPPIAGEAIRLAEAKVAGENQRAGGARRRDVRGGGVPDLRAALGWLGTPVGSGALALPSFRSGRLRAAPEVSHWRLRRPAWWVLLALTCGAREGAGWRLRRSDSG